MNKISRVSLALSGLLIVAVSNVNAGEQNIEVTHINTSINAAPFKVANDFRTDMENMQEKSFNAYIESLKKYPPAANLPEEVQQRRAAMIQKLEEQHELAMKMRRHHQQAFEKRRDAQRVRMQKI